MALASFKTKYLLGSMCSFACSFIMQTSSVYAADKEPNKPATLGDGYAAGEIESPSIEYLGIQVKYAKLVFMKNGRPIPNQEKTFVGNELKRLVQILHAKLRLELIYGSGSGGQVLSAMLILGTDSSHSTKSSNDIITTHEPRVQMEWYKAGKAYKQVTVYVLHFDESKKNTDNRVMTRLGFRKLTPEMLWNLKK